MPLLPKNYETPKSGPGLYTKFEEGETEIMICDTAIFGSEYWTTDNKPVRSPNHIKWDDMKNPKLNENGQPRDAKFFMAMPVWNVTHGCFQVMEITQTTIMTVLEYLDQSDKWPDPIYGFTISINRKGKELDTEYSVQGNPPNAETEIVADKAARAYEEAKKNGFKIERLYNGGDPFKPSEYEAAKESELGPDDLPNF